VSNENILLQTLSLDVFLFFIVNFFHHYIFVVTSSRPRSLWAMRTSCCCKPGTLTFLFSIVNVYNIVTFLLLLLGPGACEQWEHPAANPGFWRGHRPSSHARGQVLPDGQRWGDSLPLFLQSISPSKGSCFFLKGAYHPYQHIHKLFREFLAFSP
jgi:hypothetical protein